MTSFRAVHLGTPSAAEYRATTPDVTDSPPDLSGRCGSCKHFRADMSRDGTLGECRRYPPVPVYAESFRDGPDGDKHYPPPESYWPDVRPMDACGEYGVSVPVQSVCARCLGIGLHPHCPSCGLLCQDCMYRNIPAAPLPGCVRVAEELRPRGA